MDDLVLYLRRRMVFRDDAPPDGMHDAWCAMCEQRSGFVSSADADLWFLLHERDASCGSGFHQVSIVRPLPPIG